jgi:predicted nucleotide-binding protein
MKYHGSFEELQSLVGDAGFNIQSASNNQTSCQIRTIEGAIANWFPSTATVQFQGQKAPKERLQAALSELLGTRGENQHPRTFSPTAPENPKPANKKVFVVHGHDSAAREQLELIIHKLGLDPFVLQNTSGGGLTIIEALEQEIGPQSDAARFGIVLLTPDDVGYSKLVGDKEAQPRARQNVVLEMGMLISALGRANVAILKKGHIEVPSDAQGILYIPFNDHVRETVPKLVDRLTAAGFVLRPAAITKASS